MGRGRSWTLWPVAVVVLATAARGEAAQRPVRTLTTADGLPSDHLECVYRDDRGFVWLCTDDGLARYDGDRFVVYGGEVGLEPPRVRAFLESRDQRYWVGTVAGVHVLDDGGGAPRFRRVATADGARTGTVNALLEARDGTIWCGAGKGLYRIVLGEGGAAARVVAVEIGLGAAESDRIVQALVEDDRGGLWIGTTGGLYVRRADGRAARVATGAADGAADVRALAIDGSRLWIGTRNGLYAIDRRRAAADPTTSLLIEPVDRGLDLDATNIHALHVRGTSLWIGTVAGITQLVDDGRGGGLRRGRSVDGFYAWALATDADGDLWAATDAGAVVVPRDGFATYTEADGLPAARVSALNLDREGTVCATTLVARIALGCRRGDGFEAVPVAALDGVRDPGWGWSQLALQDRRDRWWIPTGEGLWVFPAGPRTALATAVPEQVYGRADGLVSSNIFRVFEQADGHVWVAAFADAGFGLGRVDPATGELDVFDRADGLPAPLPTVHAFVEDRDGAVWIGLEEGRLLRYRGGRFEELDVHPGAAWTYEELRALVVDREGRLWIASTVAGLGRIADPAAAAPEVEWSGTAAGLASNTAWAIVEDAAGSLFVATAAGVDHVDPASGRVEHYTAADGVPRGEIWGGVRDRDGRIWFATTYGATVLAPAPAAAAVPAPTFVTGIRIAGIPTALPLGGAATIGELAVEPEARRLEIEYVSPGSHAGHRVRYEYQLEGLDSSWTTTEAHQVVLAGVSPGHYRFRVRAARFDGGVGAEAVVAVHVLAPVWQRGWFLGLVGLGVAASIGGVVLLRARRRRQLAQLRTRIAADLHDGVGASLSRIAILSEVVRRQAEHELPAAVPALSVIADNARTVIDDMSDAVWFVAPGFDSVEHVIVRLRAVGAELCEDAGLGCVIEADRDAAALPLAPAARRQLYLIVKEALTNVVRHAGATRVVIELAAVRRGLRCRVDDDGVGIGVSAAPGADPGGNGLGNMRARAAAAGGRLAVTPGPGGTGTRIELWMPISRTARRAAPGA